MQHYSDAPYPTKVEIPSLNSHYICIVTGLPLDSNQLLLTTQSNPQKLTNIHRLVVQLSC